MISPNTDNENLDRFFEGLAATFERLNADTGADLERFFAELSPRLETASALERGLDRHLARRFNVLDYLRSDELGLSKIIADLLDPGATHGQGWLFLGTFLKELQRSTEIPSFRELLSLDEGEATVIVETERGTSDGRRIDVSVEIRNRSGVYCLAFENKPYAEDQERQVADYLAFLNREYEDRFLLIYLSPAGEPPSDASVSGQDLLDRWGRQFAILSYHQSDNEWEDGLFRIPEPLTEWLAACRRNCDVDRLRWFLRDVEVFCEHTFGGQAMIGHGERNAVMNFVMSDPLRLKTALAVYESWPEIRDKVCSRFLKRVYRRVKKNGRLQQLAPDLKLCWKYEGEKKTKNRLWLYRERWNTTGPGNPDAEGRYAVRMEAWGPGPSGWYIGVLAPIKGSNLSEEQGKHRKDHFAGLTTAFSGGRSSKDDWWPWWEVLDEETKNWIPLVPQLHEECEEDEDGQIMKRLADRFIEIALAAIPKIDEIEAQET